MNKKNGFTLIELIGVIVILSLLALLAGSGIIKIVKDSKNDINEAEELAITHAAEIYRAKYISIISNDCENPTIITVNDLINDKIYSLGKSPKYDESTNIQICIDSIKVGG